MTELASFVDLAEIQHHIDSVYSQEHRKLSQFLPFADIQHVGASSVQGSITKGDLDISVRVEKGQFQETLTLMDSYASRYTDSLSTDCYQPYTRESKGTSIGIQVYVSGTVFEQRFLEWRQMLSNNPALLAQYNELKRHFHGKSMAKYREAKSSFILKHHPAAA